MFGAWLRGRIVKVTHKEAAPRGAKSAHVSCGQTAGWTKMPLGTEVSLGPRDTVFDGVWGISSPLYIPHFSAHVYCGQMAGWIKMSFGTEIGRDPGYIVLDGDPAPPGKGHRSPHFSAHVYCGQRAGWIKMALGTEVGLDPGCLLYTSDAADE